jgi:OmpA-OmpF porin, OOP family
MKKIFLILSMLVFFQSQAQLLKKLKDKVDKKVDKTIDDAATGKKDEKKNTETNENTETNTNKTNEPASIKAYSKYDFVPGEKVIGFEDFSTGNIGDFPAGWNTNSAAEIVTIEGKPGRWLWITKPGVFMPEFTDKYPEDFTFEFDLLHSVPIRSAQLEVMMAQLDKIDMPQNYSVCPNRLNIGLSTSNSDQKDGATYTEIRKLMLSQAANQFYTDLLSDKNNPVHIAIWRQKERVRVYCNQEKIWDIPKAISPDAKLNALVFYVRGADANIKQYVGNLRVAVGAPDTRNKMLTQNKWVTHGILFDVNSANIKPESYGTLKEMANVLKEYADLKVKIVGHTDADGKDADNLDLSKRRAAAVKESLSKEFGIDASRMETDGKGESEPIDKNDTPAGKANNRRVEFIKM